MKWQQCVGAARVMMCRFRKSQEGGGGGEWREEEKALTVFHLGGSLGWVGGGLWGFPELEMRPSRVALIPSIQADGSARFLFFTFFIYFNVKHPHPADHRNERPWYRLLRYNRCFLVEDKTCR